MTWTDALAMDGAQVALASCPDWWPITTQMLIRRMAAVSQFHRRSLRERALTPEADHHTPCRDGAKPG